MRAARVSVAALRGAWHLEQRLGCAPHRCGLRSASVSDALRQMVTADSGRLLVTDGDRVIGLVTRSAITRFIQLKSELEEEEQ